MKHAKWTLVCALALLLVLAACTGNGSNKSAETTQPPQTATASTQGEAEADKGDAGSAGQLGKYDPPIEMTTVRFVRDGAEYPAGDSIDNNVWYRAYESELGIKLTNIWTASDAADLRDQRMSVAIAGGDLPDVFAVNARELKMLVEADMVADLTDVWNEYATDLVKENYMINEGAILEAATYNGRLMAIPNTYSGGGIDGGPMLWIRADWLRQLGKEPPRTMQDVIEIARAFTEDDPDNDGQNNTFGLGLNKNIYDGFTGVEGFFAGYHAYPYATSTTMWLNKEGKLAYGSIQPEMKPALEALARMYKAGHIDPEFSVKDGVQVAESVTSGKIGMYFGQFWNGSWPLNDMNVNGIKADWKPFPLVSIDDKPAEMYIIQPVPTEYYVVLKNYEHPEAAVKMLNFYMEKINGPEAEPDIYHTYVQGGERIELFGMALIQGAKLDNNIIQHKLVSEAIRTGDTTPIADNAEYMATYERMQNVLNGSDYSGWYNIPTFGDGGAYAIIGDYADKGLIVSNAFYGTPTDTMVERGSTLMELEHEMITKIIMGNEGIDAFDKFVDDWSKLGGDKITEEVNAWFMERQ